MATVAKKFSKTARSKEATPTQVEGRRVPAKKTSLKRPIVGKPFSGRVDPSAGIFSGKFSDLQLTEQVLASWRVLHPVEEPSRRPKLPKSFPIAAKFALEDAQVPRMKSKPAVGLLSEPATETEEAVGLYLIRSSNVSAAQALSRFDVTFQSSSRTRQLSRLKEFRGDTRSASNSEVDRWISERLPGRQSRKSSGAISAGVVVPMTHEEARKLGAEVPNLLVMRNRALSLIAPTVSSSPNSQLPPSAAWHLEAIGMSNARRDGKAFSGSGVTVALMDTGVQIDHPEIAGKVAGSWKIRDNPPTTDFQALEVDSSPYDTDGHGTHVAGLICGTSVGVAPDARLISILMMPRRLATLFDFVRCLDWAAEHPEVSLINFSAGITPFSAEMMPYVSDVINTGALPIFSIGNDGPNNTRSPGNYVDGASVGAVDSPGQNVSSFSGSGQMMWNQTVYGVPDFVAPGGQVWSSYPGNKFIAMSGTSMATPVVCGVAACLIEQANGQLGPLDLMDQLRRCCVKLASEADIRQGAGLVHAPRKP